VDPGLQVHRQASTVAAQRAAILLVVTSAECTGRRMFPLVVVNAHDHLVVFNAKYTITRCMQQLVHAPWWLGSCHASGASLQLSERTHQQLQLVARLSCQQNARTLVVGQLPCSE
jgi:hypothetical protein